ncbi:MAG: DUF1015 domain-containing protein [Lachnospiraceae bacterium]|nr:DUF1015 domain-containing protein [Lachnospiraceae bacterium]
MAIIRPFKALRPDEGLEEAVASLPYDVFSDEEAYEAVRERPCSFLNIDRPETLFPKGQDMYAPEVYEAADDMLQGFIRRRILVREEKPCYYVYSLTMGGRTQRGLCACSSVDDYLKNVIKKHENTREEKELDRIRHVDKTSCQTGPIFLAYRDDEKIEKTIERVVSEDPLYDFVSEDGIRHTVHRIPDDETVRFLTDAFSLVPNTYIADGHHRAASAVKVALKRREEHPDYDGTEEFNFFLSVLFPSSHLRIMDYNRVIKSLNGLDAEAFLKKLEALFEIRPEEGCAPVRPRKKGEFGLYLDHGWYRLNAKPAILSPDPVKGLDVSILQDNVLGPILGIADPKTDKRIDFIGGIRGLKELEKRCSEDCVAAFSMFPTSMEELFRVADAGLLMPPKSTWFEPKLRSGLFLHEIER